MLIETLSTFPQIYKSYMSASIMNRAQISGSLNFNAYNLRDWTHDAHMTTDDKPYGGGCGQLMKCEPIFEAVEDIREKNTLRPFVIFVSPHGRLFSDDIAKKLTNHPRILFVCGHYEGIDERAYTLADDILSIGDYVITSGELASMVIIDAVVRKLPNVLGNERGAVEESFVDGLLEYPQYTRPYDYRGLKVPEVLLSGDHKKIKEYNYRQSFERTKKYRPDLYKKYINNKK